MAHNNNPHWASFEDVVARWVGNDAPTNEELVDQLIHDAEHVILAEFPKIQERIDEELLDASVVKMVVVRMVTRVLRNPESLTYWQQTTGPFGQARNYGENNGDIWLSENEKALLAPKRTGKAYEVNQGFNAVSGTSNDLIWMTVRGA